MEPILYVSTAFLPGGSPFLEGRRGGVRHTDKSPPSSNHSTGCRCAWEARGSLPALGGHALGPAAGCPWRLLCHSARKEKAGAVPLLSGHGRNQACSAETAPISRPLSAAELKPVRPRSQEERGLDVAGHKPFSWGERGG